MRRGNYLWGKTKIYQPAEWVHPFGKGYTVGLGPRKSSRYNESCASPAIASATGIQSAVEVREICDTVYDYQRQ